MKPKRTPLGAAAIIAAGAIVMRAAPDRTGEPFGTMPDGTAVRMYTLKNRNGIEARVINYGGIIVSLKTPDRKGAFGDIVLGFDSLREYLANPGPFMGALIGRYGNRIGRAEFTLDGKQYHLPKNDGDNSLHGGAAGFDRRVWKARMLPDGGLELTYLSRDGEEGYPGNLTATAVYRVTDANELRIDYVATTDKDTVVNLTNHSYFNLKGAGAGDVLDHVVTLNADRFTPVDKGLIPTGELRPVSGTPFDFREAMPIGARIDQKDEQLIFGKGYDHNWVLKRSGGGLSLAARVESTASGRVLEVHTTEPGIQFYTGNFLDGTIRGKGGKLYGKRYGLCLETQHFPDSPNKKQFPSTVLKPGQRFHSTTVFRFLTRG